MDVWASSLQLILAYGTFISCFPFLSFRACFVERFNLSFPFLIISFIFYQFLSFSAHFFLKFSLYRITNFVLFSSRSYYILLQFYSIPILFLPRSFSIFISLPAHSFTFLTFSFIYLKFPSPTATTTALPPTYYHLPLDHYLSSEIRRAADISSGTIHFLSVFVSFRDNTLEYWHELN